MILKTTFTNGKSLKGGKYTMSSKIPVIELNQIKLSNLSAETTIALLNEKENLYSLRQKNSMTWNICPHCQTKGSVTTKQIKKKVGVSGGKATAGILTCGLSLFAVGLSRKDVITEAECSNCNSIWHY